MFFINIYTIKYAHTHKAGAEASGKTYFDLTGVCRRGLEGRVVLRGGVGGVISPICQYLIGNFFNIRKCYQKIIVKKKNHTIFKKLFSVQKSIFYFLIFLASGRPR